MGGLMKSAISVETAATLGQPWKSNYEDLNRVLRLRNISEGWIVKDKLSKISRL